MDTNNSQAKDSNAGTSLSAPWKTIQKAASTIVAGDTVNIRGGTYSENVTMQNSGNAANRIVYQNYNNENVIIPQDFTISKNYIVVMGLEIVGSMNINGSYCQILGNYVHDGTALFIHGSYNLVRGNKISGHAWDQITTGWGNGADHIVFEYNEVSDPQGLGEDFMQYLSHDFIARGNHFHDNLDNGRHNDLYQSGGGEYNIWIIGNLVENFHGQYYMTGDGDYDHIWRNNSLWGSIGWGFNGAPTGMRVVNNTFGTAGGGYGYSGSGKSRNNIYNDWGTEECPYGADDGDYNLVNPAPSSNSCTHGAHDVWGADPKFVNFSGHDFHLQAGSPCVNAGTFPAATTSAGSGTQIPVSDAKIFVDGFGIADGDSIQLQGQTQTARITSINYTTNVLTVDQSLTWTNGLGVSLPYNGPAPDIGAYEYKITGIKNQNIKNRNSTLSHFMYPNQMTIELLNRYFSEIKGFKIYDLSGQSADRAAIRSHGIYILQAGKNAIRQKLMVIK